MATPGPATYDVTITIQNGTITYSFAGFSLHVQRGSRVRWQSDNPFSISFGDHTPFPESGLAGGPGADAVSTVRRQARSGGYKYTVTVFPGSGVPLIDDPELYVD